MRVAVVGSRSFSDYRRLAECMDRLQDVELVVSGGARGADQLAEKWAKNRGIKTRIFSPEWEKYGKSAGVIRNKDIVNNADMVVAFWDGVSKGTAYTIQFAEKKGMNVQTVLF